VKYTQVRVLEVANSERIYPGGARESLLHVRTHGDVLVRSQVVGFKKIKFFTNENIGDGKLELPENEMHTTSYWMTLERALVESLPFSVGERQSGMFGLLHAMASVATLLLMCDGRDLGAAIGERPPAAGSGESEFAPVRYEEVASGKMKEFFEPNLYLYDAYPGGIGFSEPLFRAHKLLLEKTRELISGCECEDGCPSCIGPAGDLVPHAKEAALAILDRVSA
jgi:DEAD/DEAH box helicase domain-containing protein